VQRRMMVARLLIPDSTSGEYSVTIVIDNSASASASPSPSPSPYQPSLSPSPSPVTEPIINVSSLTVVPSEPPRSCAASFAYAVFMLAL
jgi:hypothetical protein